MKFKGNDKSPKEILNEFWGFPAFKDNQEEVITAVLSRKDTLAILPTGAGKSICYQIPGLIFEGITLVISPLIALMKDQVKQLKASNIKAEMISGELNNNEIISLFDKLYLGEIKFLFVSPERLGSSLFQEKIIRLPVSLIVVDEAHCISNWGHDFRPSYLKINLIRKLFPKANLLALTASATKKVIEEIIVNLDLKNLNIFKSSFEQKNIAYSIKVSFNKNEDLIYNLNKYKGNSIVFIRNRKECEYVSQYLQIAGFNSTFFHSKLGSNQKEERLNKWLNNELEVVVATNAFGMGIDKHNVRNIFHLSIPDSIESFYQEVGRAGRDGLEARSFLFYNDSDIEFNINQFKNKIPSKEEFYYLINRLYDEYNIGENELNNNIFNFDDSHFSKKYKISKKKLNHTLNFLDQHGILNIATYNKENSVKLLVNSKELSSINNKKYLEVLDYIERVSRNAGKYIRLNELQMALELGIFSEKIKDILNTLDKQGIIKYKLKNLSTINFLTNRSKNIIIENKPIWKLFEEVNQKIFQKILEINYFIQKNNICRKQLLLGYFNEISHTKCKKCDVCLNNQTIKVDKNIKHSILNYITTKPIILSKILNQFNQFPPEKIIEELEELIESKSIKKSNLNHFHL